MYSAVLDHEFCRMADIAIINLASFNQSLALLERKVPALGGPRTKFILDEHVGGGVGGGGDTTQIVLAERLLCSLTVTPVDKCGEDGGVVQILCSVGWARLGGSVQPCREQLQYRH